MQAPDFPWDFMRRGMTPRHLRLEVIDDGVGFEWQLSLFETPRAGFGLWSVAERIREADGEMTVEPHPGMAAKYPWFFLSKRRDPPRPFNKGPARSPKAR